MLCSPALSGVCVPLQVEGEEVSQEEEEGRRHRMAAQLSREWSIVSAGGERAGHGEAGSPRCTGLPVMACIRAWVVEAAKGEFPEESPCIICHNVFLLVLPSIK